MPLGRLRFTPAPGSATVYDVLAIHEREGKCCELVDGVLVEKAIGFLESPLAAKIIHFLQAFVLPRELGVVTAPDGMMRLRGNNVRIPDAAFVSWEQIPQRRLPRDPIPDIFPDLAVEVLSSSNSPEEMRSKRLDYFAARTRMVWEVDPSSRTVAVYTSASEPIILTQKQTLSGGDVLPGFSVALDEIFADLEE